VVSVRAINRFGKGLVVYDLVYTRDAPRTFPVYIIVVIIRYKCFFSIFDVKRVLAFLFSQCLYLVCYAAVFLLYNSSLALEDMYVCG